MLKTKKKKTIVVIVSLLSVIIIVFVLVKCLNTNKVYYADDDNGYYTGEYLCYNNGTVTVYSHLDKYADTYNLSENTKTRTDLSVAEFGDTIYFKRLYGNKVVYKKDYLYVYDIENNTDECIFKDVHGVALGRNSLAFFDFYNDKWFNRLWSYDVDNNRTEIIEEFGHQQLLEMEVQNDYLYILREKDYYYYITVFNLLTKEKEADIAINNGYEDWDDYMSGGLAIIPNGDKIYFVKNGIFKKIYQYDFSGRKEEKRFFEEDLSSLKLFTVNGDYIYYTISHGKERGLHKKNINTGEITKLSDKCDFDEIIATENYVYCYKSRDLIPESIITSELIELEQISVNSSV